MDEFSQCETAVFGTCENDNNSGDYNETNISGNSLWEMFFNLQFPFAFLWLKRSLFAVTMLFRTIIIGHFIRLGFDNFSDWMDQKTPSWLVSLLQPINTYLVGRKNHSKHPMSWPPPALMALAILTFTTLIIHPDGFTWVFLKQVKDSILFILRSLSECWQLFLSDYGVLPSIIAAITIAGLLVVMFTLLRGSRPTRKSRKLPSQNADKKRKKRKGHNARHRSGKSKSAPSSPSREDATSNILSDQHSVKPEENSITLSILTSKPTPASVSASASGSTIIEKDKAELDFDNSNRCADERATFIKRGRVSSTSTADTSNLSDDLSSCGSKSIRSIPSVGNSTCSKATRKVSHRQHSEPTLHPLHISSEMTSSKGSARNSNSSSNVPCNQKRESLPTSKSMRNGSKKLPVTSRWDALKPSSSSKSRSGPNNPLALREKTQGQKQHNAPKEKMLASNSAVARRQLPFSEENKKGRARQFVATDRKTTQLSDVSKLPIVDSHPPLSPPKISKDHITGHFLLPPAPPGLQAPSMRNGGIFDSSPEQSPIGFSLRPTARDKSTTDQQLWQSRTSTVPHSQEISQSSIINNNNTLNFHQWRTSEYSPSHTASYNQGCEGIVKKNPFAETSGSEAQIEADLQELGGQMVGSILDF